MKLKCISDSLMLKLFEPPNINFGNYDWSGACVYFRANNVPTRARDTASAKIKQQLIQKINDVIQQWNKQLDVRKKIHLTHLITSLKIGNNVV